MGKQNFRLCAAIMLVCVLLFLRDVLGLTVDKYMIVGVIALVELLLFQMDTAIAFYFFLIPLYVGLPGNFITIIMMCKLLIGFILHRREYKVNYIQLYLLLILLIVEYTHLTSANLTAIFWGIELVLLWLLLSKEQRNENIKRCVNCYLASVAFLCMMLLLIGLKYYTFNDFVSGGIRFADMEEYWGIPISGMILTIDPNFLGMFCIVAISCSFSFYLQEENKRRKKAYLLSIPYFILFGCLGLSRAFLLSLGLFILVTVFCTTKSKGRFIVRFITIIGIAFLLFGIGILAFPQLLDSLFGRFGQSDLRTLGNRTSILAENWEGFSATIYTVLFGIGVIGSNVHFTILQYLFGVGVVGMSALVVFLGLFASRVVAGSRRIVAGSFVPLLMYFFISSTIPAAYPISSVFPGIVAFLVFQYMNFYPVERR